MSIEPMNISRDRRELNTQKRNRTQTIQIESTVNSGVNMHQRGGSLNIHELYQHYHQKPKGTSVPSTRANNHQAQLVNMHNGHPAQMQNNLIGVNGMNVAGGVTATNGSIDGVYLQN